MEVTQKLGFRNAADILTLNDSNCLYRQEPGKKIFSWGPIHPRDGSAIPLTLSHLILWLLIVLIDFSLCCLFKKTYTKGDFPNSLYYSLPHHVSQSLDFKIGSRSDFQALVLQLKQSPFVLASVDSVHPCPTLNLFKKWRRPDHTLGFPGAQRCNKTCRRSYGCPGGMRLSQFILLR